MRLGRRLCDSCARAPSTHPTRIATPKEKEAIRVNQRKREPMDVPPGRGLQLGGNARNGFQPEVRGFYHASGDKICLLSMGYFLKSERLGFRCWLDLVRSAPATHSRGRS